ncbi:MAG: hypothetical protein AB3N16_07040 [Flavobacteriaceae bacterium]
MQLDKKNKLLLVGVLLLAFASYKLALEKTLMLKNETQRLTTQVEQFKDVPNKLAMLNQKNDHFDSVLGGMDMVDTSVQNNLLRTLNQESSRHKVSVIDFNKPHVYQLGDNELNTYSFKIQGDFVNVLKVLHLLENKGNFGEIIHVGLEKKKDYRTKVQRLEAEVLLQMVR